MNNIPVLMYHALEDTDHPAGAKDTGEQRYVLQTEQFGEQMSYLYRNGYRTYSLEELSEMETWPEKAVVLTFDDGHVSNYNLALSILQQYGFKAHFFITTGWIGTPYYLSLMQIKALHYAGMEIGSHGVTHRFLTNLTATAAEQELLDSMKCLASILEQPVTSFSAPGGRLSRVVADIARKNSYQIICNSEPILLKKSRDVVPRIALTKNCSMQTFAKTISADTAYFKKQQTKNVFLSVAKKILGNDRYIAIRNILLK